MLFKTRDYYRQMAIWYKQGIHQAIQQEYMGEWTKAQRIQNLEKYLETVPVEIPNNQNSTPWVFRNKLAARVWNIKYSTAVRIETFGQYLKGI